MSEAPCTVWGSWGDCNFPSVCVEDSIPLEYEVRGLAPGFLPNALNGDIAGDLPEANVFRSRKHDKRERPSEEDVFFLQTTSEGRWKAVGYLIKRCVYI